MLCLLLKGLFKIQAQITSKIDTSNNYWHAKNDTDDSLFCLITFGAFLYGVEIDRVSWSWDPCHWWIQCNLWEKASVYWAGQYWGQPTGLQTTLADHSWPGWIHFWGHSFWGNTVPVDYRWEEVCGLLAWRENRSWH